MRCVAFAWRKVFMCGRVGTGMGYSRERGVWVEQAWPIYSLVDGGTTVLILVSSVDVGKDLDACVCDMWIKYLGALFNIHTKEHICLFKILLQIVCRSSLLRRLEVCS
jgi:hypothetical protein